MTRKSVVRSFKNTVAVAVQCRYINDAFAGFCQQIFEKKCFEGYLRKNLQKIFVTLSKFWPFKGVGGVELGESVKEEKFAMKIFFR